MGIVRKTLELSTDLLEPAVDSILNSGFLRDIPILGSAVKAADLARSVRDHIFLAKVERFLEGLESASAKDFADETSQDNELAARVGEAVLLAIDSINDLEKAPILGYIFAAYLRGEIGFGTLRRLNNAVTLSMVDDLWALAEQRPDNRWEEDEHADRLQALHALRITGLTALEDSAFQLVGRRSFIGTEVTGLGKVLIEILRNSPGPSSNLTKVADLS